MVRLHHKFKSYRASRRYGVASASSTEKVLCYTGVSEAPAEKRHRGESLRFNKFNYTHQSTTKDTETRRECTRCYEYGVIVPVGETKTNRHRH